MSNPLPGYYLFTKHYDRIDVDEKQASTIAGLKRSVANACAVRLSYAFNHLSGHKIPSKPPGVHGNVGSGVNGNYILGSKGFANYLSKQYFQPVVHKPSEHQKNHADRKGIIFYDVRIWSDAYGHIAMWDGAGGYRGEFFKEARKVWLWEMASGPGALVNATL